MEIKKLRKDNHKLVIGGLIAFCLLAVTVTYLGTRAKYQNTEIIPLVNGVVNYKAYDFKVMAMYQQKDGQTCTEDNCYNIITSMPDSGYIINETKSYCTVDNKNHSNARLFTNELNQHVFEKITKNDKCYLWFDKIIGRTIDDIVADATTAKTDFSTVAKTDEGTFLADDPMYGENAKTTYYRGAVTNNWVKFGGHFWRIIRKNGDGTLRLIYTGTAEGTDASKIPNVTISGATAQGIGTQIGNHAYVVSNSSTNSYPMYVGWTYKTGSARPTSINNNGSEACAAPANADTAPTSTTTEYRSTAYEQTLAWFNSNISATDQVKVDDGKFCNDRQTQDGGIPATSNTAAYYKFAAYKRLYTNKAPVFTCANESDVYTTKVGLITADEVAFAGGIVDSGNKIYYLYANQYSWTMTPYYWWYVSSTDRTTQEFYLNIDGGLYAGNIYAANGIRPVINLKADTLFSSTGDGTYNNPYVVL